MKIYFLILVAFVLTACGNAEGRVIAHIAEASGISYCASTDTLIVANDEGRYMEINSKGKILRTVKMGKYDFEGVVCEGNTLWFAVENKGVLKVDRTSGQKQKIALDTFYEDKKLALLDKKEGIEGIAKQGNILYLAKQSKKRKGSFVAVFRLEAYPARVIDVLRPPVADISGLCLHEGYLYMVSDKKDLLLQYDVKEKSIVKKVKLEKGAWEGIAFDARGNVYLADDDGRVLKYKIETFF